MGTAGVCRTSATLPPSGGVVPISPSSFGRIQAAGGPRPTRDRHLAKLGSASGRPKGRPGVLGSRAHRTFSPVQTTRRSLGKILTDSPSVARRRQSCRLQEGEACASYFRPRGRGSPNRESRLGILMSWGATWLAFEALQPCWRALPPSLPIREFCREPSCLPLFTSWCGRVPIHSVFIAGGKDRMPSHHHESGARARERPPGGEQQ